MSTQHINYLNRDFAGVREDILKYSKENYPQLTDNFGNDSSITSWLVDVMSDCVDSLNYHIDRTYQNTQISSTQSKSALLNLARSNGLKIPGPKASMCEVEFSCILPCGYKEGGTVDMSQPNWNAAPVIQRGCIVTGANKSFVVEDNVDFSEQFNSNGASNRTYAPVKDNQGNISSYKVTKSVLAIGGNTQIYKKVMTSNDITPFMEIVLPEKDVMNIESIIFKSANNLKTTPEISEFYVDEEEYQFNNSPLLTYRFFETNALIDQWRFGTEMSNMDNLKILDRYNPEKYEDYNDNGVVTRYYKGAWKPLRQKFITEYTDNGYMKIIFGPGVDYQEYPSDQSTYTQYRMSSIMNNDMLGVLPKEGWTMYVLYKTGGGVDTNLAKGAIQTIKSSSIDFPHSLNDDAITTNQKNSILKTLQVTNITASVNGKDAPSVNEIKYMIKYNTQAQDRCVTVKDYEIKAMQMPPKYGSPFRCSAIEENNKIVLSLLNINKDGKLTKAISNTLAENLENYLTKYKTIGDYVEIKSGKIYDLAFLVDVLLDKSYNAADVIANVTKTINNYMDINKHSMGEDIYIGDLNKELSLIDGVINLIDLKIYKVNDGGYSSDKCPLPSVSDTNTNGCGNTIENATIILPSGAKSEEIDLAYIDSILIGDNNAMYQIHNPNNDIQVRVKQR